MLKVSFIQFSTKSLFKVLHSCIEANRNIALHNKADLFSDNFLALFTYDSTVVFFKLVVFTEAKYLHQIMYGGSFK